MTWLENLFTKTRVTGKPTPWGTAYTVWFGESGYRSSADGTLWSMIHGGGPAPFSESERCRRAVRRARKRNAIEVVGQNEWGDLLESFTPEHRGQILAGGLRGKEDAVNSGLLP